MKTQTPLDYFPKNFQDEVAVIKASGIGSWDEIALIEDIKIRELSRRSKATERNLTRIRGIARLVYLLQVSYSEAALLLHAGIPSVEAILKHNSSEIVHKTGRLERQLQTKRKPIIDISKASSFIKKAKDITK